MGAMYKANFATKMRNQQREMKRIRAGVVVEIYEQLGETGNVFT